VTIRLFLLRKRKNLFNYQGPKALLRDACATRFFYVKLAFLALILFGFLIGQPSFAQTTLVSTIAAEPSEKLTDVVATDTDFFDQSRNRRVPVRIYAPLVLTDSADTTSTTSLRSPLIVFSHGLGGSRNGYSYIGRYLAARGYIVMHTQHEGSDRSIWTTNIFSLYSNMQSATREAHAIDRVFDVQFAITEILKKELWAQRIDPLRIGIAGHSYGANTALMLSGAKIDRMNAPLNDPRIKAALIISAPPFHGEGEMQPILGQIKIPSLHVTGTEDVIRVPGYRSTLDDRVAVFEATGAQLTASEQLIAQKRLVVFKGGTHSVFTDRTDRSGPELNSTIKKGTQELALAFFDTSFRQLTAKNLDQWIEINKEILVRTFRSRPEAVQPK
jgi:pimeloyl-ACP methyl ester carboxylesterase